MTGWPIQAILDLTTFSQVAKQLCMLAVIGSTASLLRQSGIAWRRDDCCAVWNNSLADVIERMTVIYRNEAMHANAFNYANQQGNSP